MENQIKALAQEITFDFNKSTDKDFIRRIELAIIGYRATIIRQDYNKNGRFPVDLQESFCVPMILVKETECCSTGDDTCKVYRSEFKIPSPVRVKDNTNFLFVGNTNNTKGYDSILPEEWISIKEGTKFAKRLRFFSYYNSYLYTFNSELPKIRVRYVPENPEELINLKSCDGTPCITSIKLPEDMKKIIKDWIAVELGRKNVPQGEEINIDGNS